MANLELSRAVNDALQNGDFSAAFGLLEEFSNLRASDLPTWERATVRVIQNDFCDGNAQLCAQMLTAQSASKRRFALKIWRVAGAKAQNCAPLLRPQLEKFVASNALLNDFQIPKGQRRELAATHKEARNDFKSLVALWLALAPLEALRFWGEKLDEGARLQPLLRAEKSENLFYSGTSALQIESTRLGAQAQLFRDVLGQFIGKNSPPLATTQTLIAQELWQWIRDSLGAKSDQSERLNYLLYPGAFLPFLARHLAPDFAELLAQSQQDESKTTAQLLEALRPRAPQISPKIETSAPESFWDKGERRRRENARAIRQITDFATRVDYLVSPPLVSENLRYERRFNRVLMWQMWGGDADFETTKTDLANAVLERLWPIWKTKIAPKVALEKWESETFWNLEILAMAEFLILIGGVQTAREIGRDADQLKNPKLDSLKRNLEGRIFIFISGGEISAVLDASWEPFLDEYEMRARRNFQWRKTPPNSSEIASSLGALVVGFSRLKSESGREKGLKILRELVSPASLHFQSHRDLGEIATQNLDGELWLETVRLATNAAKQSEFFPIYRATFPQRCAPIIDRIFGLVETSFNPISLEILQSVFKNLSPDERAKHSANLLALLEHPNARAAKWALETLLQMPNATLDWPRAIENAGEKLWGESVGLAKVAAKFLGAVPKDNAKLAWEKLESALELENLALLEAVLRALARLKTENQALKLDSGVQKLESLALLAPERFGKLAARIKAPN